MMSSGLASPVVFMPSQAPFLDNDVFYFSRLLLETFSGHHKHAYY